MYIVIESLRIYSCIILLLGFLTYRTEYTVGMMMPQRIRTGKLTRGQMGYVIAGLRDPREARPGKLSIVRLTDGCSTSHPSDVLV